jgi:hypothetical protein
MGSLKTQETQSSRRRTSGGKNMAQRVQVVLEDDIDGGEAHETISFSLDGVSYEIDLSEDNAAKLRDAFAVYVGSGRRVGGRSTSGRAARSAGGSTSSSSGAGGSRRGRSGEPAKIREWARANGREVSGRGRVSAELREAYEKAHA